MNAEEFSSLPQNDKDKALLTFVGHGDITNIKTSIGAGANVNYVTRQGYTPLYESMSIGNQQIVKILLDAGATIDVPGDGYNGPPLVWAAAKGDVNIMKLLLEKGGNINIKHENDIKGIGGSTALHKASKNKRDNAILFLIDKGADLTITNKYGQTAMDVMAEEYIEPFNESIIRWEKEISVHENAKAKITRRMENPANKDKLKSLQSDLKTQQQNVDQYKGYRQQSIDSKERGRILIKSVVEKAINKKIPLTELSRNKFVKELYNDIMKVRKGERRGAAELAVKNNLPAGMSKEIAGFIPRGGKRKTKKLNKSKAKKHSKKRFTKKAKKSRRK